MPVNNNQDPTIEIEVGIPSDVAPEVIQGQEQIAVQEDQLVGEFQPTGRFSKKSLNTLVKVTKQLQPMFGLNADYPNFTEDQTEFPIEFVRLLLMFKQSIDDAIVEDVVGEEETFTLEEITDDKSIQLLAGKLGMVARDKKFKKWLARPEAEAPTEVPAEDIPPLYDEERTPLPEASDQSIDSLFMERL